MKKKKYEKPQLKVVRIELSECIAGSAQINSNVNVVRGSKTSTIKEVQEGGSSWDSSF